jgi:uncharacterized membrane protein
VNGGRHSAPSGEPSPNLEHTIARLLTIGTYVSVVFLVIGVGLMLMNGFGPSGGPALDPGRVVSDLAGLRPAGFLWLGLIVVVATPSGRVAAALAGYLRRGEPRMAIVATLILFVIGLSVVLAIGLEG